MIEVSYIYHAYIHVLVHVTCVYIDLCLVLVRMCASECDRVYMYKCTYIRTYVCSLHKCVHVCVIEYMCSARVCDCVIV